LAWDTHALFTRPLDVFNANIFYPLHNTLAFSENLLGSVVVAAPVLWITSNPVLAMNAVSLASCVLCGLGAYVLARRVGLSASGAFVCGMIFAFSPARLFRFQQIFLTTVQWMPFSLAFLYSYFRSRRPADLRWAIAFFAAQALTSGHGAVFLLIAAATLVLFEIGTHIRFTPAMLRSALRESTRVVRDVGIPGLLLVAPAALVIPPYLAAQREIGLRRTIGTWTPMNENFLASPTHVHSWILTHAISIPINERANAFLFPGYLPLVLGIVALVPITSQFRRATAMFALVVCIALWFCIGPPMSIWPWVYWLPGFNFIRVPSRFAIVALLGLSVLAGISFDRLAIRFWPQNRIAALIIVTILCTAEFAAIPLPVTPYRVEYPAIDRWLATQPKPFAIAEVPVGRSERYHSTYMLHSMAHWQRTVHGYSGFFHTVHDRLYPLLRSFPDLDSLTVLRELNVDYVVVHSNGYRPDEWPDVEKRLASYSSELRLLHEEQDGRVYAILKAREQDAR